MKRIFTFTSESVTEGHPDKVADQISDAVLDAIIADDKHARVACETFITTGTVIVGGEITTETYADIPSIVRKTIREIGYTDTKHTGFDADTCGIMTSIDKQSPDIAMGVNSSDTKEQGAGDQGLMFGYATNENADYMPTPILLAHKLCYTLAAVRKSQEIDYLGPDGKSQVSIRYENNIPVAVDKVVVSSQHYEGIEHEKIEKDIIEKVIKKVIPADLLHDGTDFLINPTGKFVLGGPVADAGLTGRKIIVDTYGGWGRHGGGAFSGKDPSKVDRSASYMARYIAKNIVAAGLADKCEIQIAYAIGVARPVSVYANTFGTAKVDETIIEKAVNKVFDMRPAAIIEKLDLLRPIYKKTASYGHFGRDGMPWEVIDKVEELKRICF